jgi:hypothetical protein
MGNEGKDTDDIPFFLSRFPFLFMYRSGVVQSELVGEEGFKP